MLDDDELMVRLQEGDSRAFEELVERHQGRLIGFFFTNTRDRQLAEDLTQETLLRVFDQAWDYLPVGKFQGWMYRIARNLLIDTVRRRSHDALIKAVQSNGEEETTLAGVAAEILSPEALADQREIVALVDDLLQQLPDDQRLTFTLHHYAGLSLGEVADIMETTLPTSKSRFRLAKEKLQERLLERGIGVPGER